MHQLVTHLAAGRGFGQSPVLTVRLAIVAAPPRPHGTAASSAVSFVARRVPLLERLDFPYSLDDHSPTRYIEASRTSLLGR
jgi:hypothetical protein